MLFVTFLLTGIVLFLLIYAYSVMQLKKQNIEVSEKPKSDKTITNIRSFFDKFKKKSVSNEPVSEVKESSMTVGGVTAKVKENIINKVESVISSDHPSITKEERIAPTIGDANVNQKGFNDVSLNDPEPVSMINVDHDPGIIAVDKESQSITEEPLNHENFKAKETVNEHFEEQALEQSLNEISPQESINTVIEEKMESDSQLGDETVSLEDLQQDLLSQPELFEQSQPSEIDQYHNTDDQDSQISSKHAVDSKDNKLEENLSDLSARSFANEHAAIDDGLKESNANQQLPDTPPKKEFKADANAIEIVAKIHSDEVVLRDVLLTTYRKFDYLFTRHLGIFGKNSLTNVWQDVEHSSQDDQFNEIAISLQLADKTGAMTRKESNTFSTLSVQMADELNKTLEFSMDLDESVERGRMLDELARKYDALVVCNIIPKRRKGFRSTDIKSCTKDLRMMPASNGVFGRFEKIDGVNTLRYSLALADRQGEFIQATTRDPFQVEEIVVFMNVPLVARPVEAFESMIEDARKLGAWMDGKLVDKNANNMTTKTLEKIIEQIAIIEKEMRLDGLVPGSGVCKKLF